MVATTSRTTPSWSRLPFTTATSGFIRSQMAMVAPDGWLALFILRRAGVAPVLFTNENKSRDYYPCFREKSPTRMIEYFRTHQVSSWE